LAIKSGEFTPEFDGEDSLIDRDGDNVIFTISALNPFKLGSNVEVRIRTEDLDNNVYNFSYIFSVIPNNPILIDSNPKNDQIIKNPQILYFSFEDVIYDVDVSSLKILLEDNILLNNSSFNEDFYPI
jgi:hypothetical protein